MLDIIDILHSAESAILAIVLHRLMQPGMIFGFWGRTLARKQWSWPDWVRKPLGDCFTCFSGWVGIVSGVALEIYRHQAHVVIFEPVLTPWIEAVLRILFHTTFTIYFADILTNGTNQKA